MDDLNKYVEGLFAGHKESNEVEELKAEVLGNLEARLADYIEEGVPYEEALARAKRNLETVDFLVPADGAVYVNRYRLELNQAGLLYTVIAWVLTIPLRFTLSGIVANIFLLFLAFGLGVSYMVLSSWKGEAYLNAAAPLDQKRLGRHGRAAWLIWTLFIAVTVAFTTIKCFGSDIWFGRSLHMDGPYRFAQVAIAYVLPFVAVILPLLYTKARALAKKHEVKN